MNVTTDESTIVKFYITERNNRIRYRLNTCDFNEQKFLRTQITILCKTHLTSMVDFFGTYKCKTFWVKGPVLKMTSENIQQILTADLNHKKAELTYQGLLETTDTDLEAQVLLTRPFEAQEDSLNLDRGIEYERRVLETQKNTAQQALEKTSLAYDRALASTGLQIAS